MAVALLPYAELLLFLAGTVLYGFLLRELIRRPDVLPSGRPLRLLAVALLLWYAGTLVDLWLVFLIGPLQGASMLGASLDVLRGLGWLLAPPLLLHTLENLWTLERGRSFLLRALVLAGYASFGLFLGPMLDVLLSRSPFLADATQAFYPRLVVQAAICFLPAAWVAWQLAVALGSHARMARFLRSLARMLVWLLILLALGLATNDVWSADPSLLGAVLRLLILGALLLPGILFAYFVQRYNLLRLSLSNRFLRQLAILLVLVALSMLGPALGIADAAVFKPIVAWGLLLALGWSVFSAFTLERLIERSATWRVFFGRAVTAPRLESLMVRLESLAGDDDQLMSETASSLSEWLGCQAAFLPRTLATEALWRALDASGLQAARGLSRLPRDLSRELDRHDLQALFALRIRSELRGILGLSSSVTGGGHGEDELEGVSLVLRQLQASLMLRQLSRERLAEERRAAEQERLGLLGLVSASLAHEIKNPLSSIKVLAQALREEMAAEDSRAEAVLDLEMIVEQIDRLDLTAREILSFARTRPEDRTDLAPLLRSAIYVLRAEAKKRSVEIEAELEVQSGQVLGSPATWQTMTFNLLRNAVDHTPRQGVVRLSLREQAGNAIFEVSNPGHLDAEVRERLFEPFISASESSGLGLALVARRAQEIGARVRVEERDGRVHFRVEAALELGEQIDEPRRQAAVGSPGAEAESADQTRREGSDEKRHQEKPARRKDAL